MDLNIKEKKRILQFLVTCDMVKEDVLDRDYCHDSLNNRFSKQLKTVRGIISSMACDKCGGKGFIDFADEPGRIETCECHT